MAASPNCPPTEDSATMSRRRRHQAGHAKQLLHLVFGGELKSLADIEFANLDAARHRRHLSQLRRGLQSLEGGRAAHRRQRADALLHRPHAPPARPSCHASASLTLARRCRQAASAWAVSGGFRTRDLIGTCRSETRISGPESLGQDAPNRRARRFTRSRSTRGRRARCGALSPTGSVPRWREIAARAASSPRAWRPRTGGYPLIIKHSFDSLMKADSGVLPWVLVAIVVVTTLRSLFLYLQPGDGGAHRHAHDDRHPEGGLRASDQRRFRAPDARDHRAASSPGSPTTSAFIQQAAQVVAHHLRPRHPVGDRRCSSLMLYLDWMMTLIVLGVYPAGGAAGRAASASGCAGRAAARRPSSAT